MAKLINGKQISTIAHNGSCLSKNYYNSKLIFDNYVPSGTTVWDSNGVPTAISDTYTNQFMTNFYDINTKLIGNFKCQVISPQDIKLPFNSGRIKNGILIYATYIGLIDSYTSFNFLDLRNMKDNASFGQDKIIFNSPVRVSMDELRKGAVYASGGDHTWNQWANLSVKLVDNQLVFNTDLYQSTSSTIPVRIETAIGDKYHGARVVMLDKIETY
ncbi:hypothetical protein [Levilactobacillus brevis]|uniref:hypothetical protein n=1 Tax=Levilactobacillus brevis TaxID=1580 RepID=UPI0020744098|nr:hypothetical protein [Levilactobacillus brevis]